MLIYAIVLFISNPEKTAYKFMTFKVHIGYICFVVSFPNTPQPDQARISIFGEAVVWYCTQCNLNPTSQFIQVNTTDSPNSIVGCLHCSGCAELVACCETRLPSVCEFR